MTDVAPADPVANALREKIALLEAEQKGRHTRRRDAVWESFLCAALTGVLANPTSTEDDKTYEGATDTAFGYAGVMLERWDECHEK